MSRGDDIAVLACDGDRHSRHDLAKQHVGGERRDAIVRHAELNAPNRLVFGTGQNVEAG
ncbi:hypothetical protein WGT02_12860 [Rhizobium sp. T1470]|uniref:hypothetical protein n=1 Tax=unclassified Rhizobium TaxID=2613769 RepID=UPI001CD68A3A|nr:hypothetical protein [Rhizobium sp. T1473]MCA0802119.1 hypothetical protein [Rhizobium sp. T1473]